MIRKVFLIGLCSFFILSNSLVAEDFSIGGGLAFESKVTDLTGMSGVNDLVMHMREYYLNPVFFMDAYYAILKIQGSFLLIPIETNGTISGFPFNSTRDMQTINLSLAMQLKIPIEIIEDFYISPTIGLEGVFNLSYNKALLSNPKDISIMNGLYINGGFLFDIYLDDGFYIRPEFLFAYDLLNPSKPAYEPIIINEGSAYKFCIGIYAGFTL